MSTRRDFMKTTLIAGSGILMNSNRLFASQTGPYISHRPELSKRNFSSEVIDEVTSKVASDLKDKELAWMFGNCFPNTLDTTVRYGELDGRPDTFVITGDIPAMWLRDSTAQVWPYLPYVKEDENLQNLLAGVVNRQTKCVLIDPYANAFNYGRTGSEWDSDLTEMKPELHERKWEIDSLCYTIRLANGYYRTTGDNSVFTPDWKKAVQRILQTFKEQQRFDSHGPYRFERVTEKATDTLPLNGYGNPTRPNGLINSMFRPSDDACIYPYLIPSNYFAVLSLKQAAAILKEVYKDDKAAADCLGLASQVEDALKEYAATDHLKYGRMFSYEVDGYGNRLFMDDANIPSLLAMPYLGTANASDETYQNTRHFVLSEDNPYFFKGTAAEGIGGPHVGMNMIWPMSIIMRAMTSGDEKEIVYCLRMLKNTHAGTGFMHESFYKDNPKRFSRKWFAWANTLFGELILKIYHEDKSILNSV